MGNANPFSSKQIILHSAEETLSCAEKLSRTIQAPALIFLEGQLGAGKTTFVRGLLRGLGYTGVVKSPTFTLIEQYDFNNRHVVHADLYRLQSIDELELMGFRDYLTDDVIAVIEWAEYAKAYLPEPTLVCTFTIMDDGRLLKITESKA